MTCKHLKVKQDCKVKRNGEGYDYYSHYICPDCSRPIKVESNWSLNPNGCKPRFKIAHWARVGCGDYWKELQPNGTFKFGGGN